ncbi:hypothetical protein O9993_06125 [Vibrio lentus]|nr:hypothetical protein [Vibrio lentus]
MPAILDIATYLFINALTRDIYTVVFLYSTDTIPASVSVLNMDDAGQTGAAAAMAVMNNDIGGKNLGVGFMLINKLFEKRTQTGVNASEPFYILQLAKEWLTTKEQE